MRSESLTRCHACNATIISGCVVSRTCDACRDKGHKDLNCPACRSEDIEAIARLS